MSSAATAPIVSSHTLEPSGARDCNNPLLVGEQQGSTASEFLAGPLRKSREPL